MLHNHMSGRFCRHYLVMMRRNAPLGAALFRVGGRLFGRRMHTGATLGFELSCGGASESPGKANVSINLSEGVSRNGAPVTLLRGVAFPRLSEGSTGGHRAFIPGNSCYRVEWEILEIYYHQIYLLSIPTQHNNCLAPCSERMPVFKGWVKHLPATK